MNEQISKALRPFRQFWAGAAKGVKTMILVGIIAAVAVALGLSIFLNTKDYVVIYDQLTATETSEILAQLQTMSVDVRLNDKGEIMVPKKNESSVRMTLATAGYPKSGLSYYMIEQGSGMLTTDYERQQYVNIQLQERIGASIKTLDGVKDAIVTITAPGENVFYLQEKEPPSASVIIHMQSGNVLGESQVLGIQNLVVKSVLGLTRENVVISDSSGNELTAGAGGSGDFSNISITKKIEDDIRKKIFSVLEGPYDSSKLRISVSAVVNTDDLFKEETIYSPSPDGDNTGVISQESRSEENSSSTQSDGGIAGTSSNSEVTTYPVSGVAGESTSGGSSESTTYLVSQIISQFQKDGAQIESVSIGIAIDKAVFAPEEKERVIRLVSHAVGVAPESIAVENFQFYSSDTPVSGVPIEKEGIDRRLIYAGAGAAALLAIIATVVTVLLKKKRRKEDVRNAELLSAESALDELFGREQQPLPQITPVRDAKREQIKEFALSNPEIAAQMIRSWLKSDNEA